MRPQRQPPPQSLHRPLSLLAEHRMSPLVILHRWGLMARAKNALANKVLGALPRIPARGLTPPETPAPFPFHSIFQNGPRCQGFASPRKPRAPLTAPGRSEDISQTWERALMECSLVALSCLPLVGPKLFPKTSTTTQSTIQPRKESWPADFRVLQAHLSMRICLRCHEVDCGENVPNARV